MSTTRDQIDAESRKDPERLEREIDQQRDIIGNIVSALENKLSPSEIVDRVMHASKGNGGEFARNLGNVVRANPVPALLASAGLVWLYASRHDSMPVQGHARGDDEHTGTAASSTSSAVHDSGHRSAGAEGSASGLREGISERASHLRENASHKFGSAKERAGETAHHAADTVRHQAGRAREGFSHMMEDNPLVIGAIAIGIGALLGAALPVTRKEDELMGEAGDKLRSKASDAGDTVREKGREVVDSVREKGAEAARGIKDEVRAGSSSPDEDHQGSFATAGTRGSAGASTPAGYTGTGPGTGNSPHNTI